MGHEGQSRSGDPMDDGQGPVLTPEEIERYQAARASLNHGKPPTEGGRMNLRSTPGSREDKTEALVLRDELDAKALELRARRMSYREIAKLLGFTHPVQASRAVKRAMANQDPESILEQRQQVLLHYDQMAQIVYQVLEAKHLVVSNGRVVRLKGKPLQDGRPILEAVDRLMQIERDKAMVTGVRAPKVSQVLITNDTVESAIAALEATLGTGPGHPEVGGWDPGRAAPIEAEVFEGPTEA